MINKTASEEKGNQVRFHDFYFYVHYRQVRDQVSPSLEVEIKVNDDNLARAWSINTVQLFRSVSRLVFISIHSHHVSSSVHQ